MRWCPFHLFDNGELIFDLFFQILDNSSSTTFSNRAMPLFLSHILIKNRSTYIPSPAVNKDPQIFAARPEFTDLSQLPPLCVFLSVLVWALCTLSKYLFTTQKRHAISAFSIISNFSFASSYREVYSTTLRTLFQFGFSRVVRFCTKNNGSDTYL